ncbi:alpha/beta hydrolase family protein [Microbacterium sp. AG1240]|uniref:alpha/beta fold hydrolase n=1 Tax=Microbacterium sp. AG1240 TaxID=2183992 RepID=UPI000EAF4283|nr:alpha/beta fold hydrolase [Microbacterium sp. AG1240]RKT31403.1 alpha/beta hydrolase family protein [Microbacterium sp. AG1240]
MPIVESADGTPIRAEATGDGPVVVVVNGAFSTAADASGVADALVRAGFTAVVYDRRARAGSGDTHPYAPEREADDLAAVIAGVGGAAAVLGHSSGAVLALLACSLGVSTGTLFLSEPPFHFGEGEPPSDLPERLQRAIDEGRPADAVTTFQIDGVGLPPAMIEQMRSSPVFDGLVALAQSTVYDATLTRQVSTPTAAMREVDVPVVVLTGSDTFPFLHAASERLAEEVSGAVFVEVPESVQHRLDPVATARVVAAHLHA